MKIEFQQEQNLENIFEIINDFLVLYSLPTAKNESLDAITFPRDYSVPQFLITDRWNMNLNSEMTKYSVFNKHSLFPLFRGISSQHSKNCSNFKEPIQKEYKETTESGTITTTIESTYIPDQPISNEIFKNFFNHKNKEICKLFFATRKMDKYQKFTTLYTCLEVLIRHNTTITSNDEIKKEKQTGKQVRYFFEHDNDIKQMLDIIDIRIIKEDYIGKIIDNRNEITHGNLFKVDNAELRICCYILERIVYYLLMKDLGIDAELLKNRSYVDFNIIRNLISENLKQKYQKEQN